MTPSAPLMLGRKIEVQAACLATAISRIRRWENDIRLKNRRDPPVVLAGGELPAVLNASFIFFCP